MAGFGPINSNDAGTTALSDFLDQLQKVAEQLKSQEVDLNKLKITNVENLAHLQAQRELELVNQWTKLKLKAAEKINEREKTHLTDLETQKTNAEKLGDKEKTKQLDKQIKQEKKRIETLQKVRTKAAQKDGEEAVKTAKKKAALEEQSEKQKAASQLLGSNKTLQERTSALKDIFSTEIYDDEGNSYKKFSFGKGLDTLTHALGDMAKQLDNTVEKVAGYKSKIDTRLQGLNRKAGGFFGGGSGT